MDSSPVSKLLHPLIGAPCVLSSEGVLQCGDLGHAGTGPLGAGQLRRGGWGGGVEREREGGGFVKESF